MDLTLITPNGWRDPGILQKHELERDVVVRCGDQ
jgi:hypothetical protein